MVAVIESVTQSRKSPTAKFGEGFTYDTWWFAALSADLKPGVLQRYELLGEPVLLGRNRAGEVYALRDVCPHRAAPLSAGRLVKEPDGRETVECPYHGWRFGADGACAAIPSLVEDQNFPVERVKVRRYPVAESQGLVFIWMASDPRNPSEPDHAHPTGRRAPAGSGQDNCPRLADLGLADDCLA